MAPFGAHYDDRALKNLDGRVGRRAGWKLRVFREEGNLKSHRRRRSISRARTRETRVARADRSWIDRSDRSGIETRAIGRDGRADARDAAVRR